MSSSSSSSSSSLLPVSCTAQTPHMGMVTEEVVIQLEILPLFQLPQLISIKAEIQRGLRVVTATSHCRRDILQKRMNELVQQPLPLLRIVSTLFLTTVVVRFNQFFSLSPPVFCSQSLHGAAAVYLLVLGLLVDHFFLGAALTFLPENHQDSLKLISPLHFLNPTKKQKTKRRT